jgi:peptidoglycan/xylan/chitin deacetylase (PgdA/CDA1 family)
MWDRLNPVWPEGVKCPVVLTFDFDAESIEFNRAKLDGTEPNVFGRHSLGQYSPRVAAPRILDLLERHNIPSTWFIPAFDAERNPELVKEISERGHEVASHNYCHEHADKLTAEEERDVLTKSDRILSELTGKPVKGWRTPSGYVSKNTYPYIHEMEYKYSSSFNNDDNPYIIELDGKKVDMVELPFAWILDDAPLYTAFVKFRNSEVLEMWREEFDTFYKHRYYYSLCMHPRYTGRMTRIEVLDKLIGHIKRHEGIWWAKSIDVAEWVLKKEKEG